MAQVVVLKLIPEGREGVIAQDVILPPVFIGLEVVKGAFWVRINGLPEKEIDGLGTLEITDKIKTVGLELPAWFEAITV